MKINIVTYREHKRNTLLAFLDLKIAEIGLTIKGCSLHEKEDRRWIGLPQRSYATETGEKKYVGFLWFEKDSADEFRAGAMEAIDAYHAKIEGRQENSDKPCEPFSNEDIPF